jgi:hypothetical protein
MKDKQTMRTYYCLFVYTTLSLAAVIQMTSLIPAAANLDDLLPDTTGLFFGKRASHLNMNNLLFGNRFNEDAIAFNKLLPGVSSVLGAAARGRELREKEAELVCRAVRRSCEKYRLWDDED